jgi:tetratricopeptide (TPR) repeat protein
VLREEPRRAVQLLARAVVLDPDRELHWTKLGGGAHTAARMSRVPAERLELYRMARAALQRAVLLSPLNGYHHANLGHVTALMAREGAGSPAQAYAAYDRALELDCHNVNFYADAANAALGFEDRSRARDYAARGTGMFPQFAPTLAQLGYLALAERNYTEAVNLLCRAVHGQWYEHQKLRPLALANLAMAYLNLGLFDDAVNAGTQALEKAEFVELRCNFGMALEKLGRPAEAARNYREVLAKVPGHPKARAGIRRLLDARRVTPGSLLHPPVGN